MASKKKRHSTFIGPVGKDVQVTFSNHSLGRLIERFTPEGPGKPQIDADLYEQMAPADRRRVFEQAIDAGLRYEEFVDGIRNPNAGRLDEVSHLSYGAYGRTKLSRWFRPVTANGRVICHVVFVVLTPASDSFPGSIRIITVMDQDQR